MSVSSLFRHFGVLLDSFPTSSILPSDDNGIAMASGHQNPMDRGMHYHYARKMVIDAD